MIGWFNLTQKKKTRKQKRKEERRFINEIDLNLELGDQTPFFYIYMTKTKKILHS